MENMLEFGRQILAAQAFSRLLKAELVSWSEDLTELRVPLSEDTEQHLGMTHGGVICYAADNALTYAGGAVLGAGVVTGELKINYIRPAIGSALIARASALHAGRTQAVVRCDVFVVDGQTEKLCATALGTIRKVEGAGDGSPPANRS
ncbi:PaaI family thioesterase [Microbaculum marinisediminis]|uniref:Medium/long-chain acyl-CoA thioesterase YigI n=1 Tax=Microbaculum marinisediminis TaxID=2931392 RepID=A0AAW5QVD7_9HYPH|nr:PaaI family thioesterase [Microbaculum sp. A6E488]MCT8970628.1 PaaI family thioesterase [Microbaculum sp. A6E488]